MCLVDLDVKVVDEDGVVISDADTDCDDRCYVYFSEIPWLVSRLVDLYIQQYDDVNRKQDGL